MILTTLPDLPPLPETNANAEFRRRFYARWGKENAVVCGQSTRAEYATMTQTLSIKMAWRGRERYRLRHREVAVDDENYLILNEGSRYGSVLKADRPAWTFAVFMRPGIDREVRAARRLALGQALEKPDPGAEGGGFSEHLRRHDELVSPVLRGICEAVLDGERGEEWLEEQLLLLLDGMIAADAADSRALDRLARAKPSTRAELARRLRLAADYIESCHAEPIGLEAMAAVACLSRFHFVRAFKMLYGVTPHTYLLQRRAAAARRLMQSGEHDRDRVAVQAGFGSRSSLRRALVRRA
ncbi:MAG: helix-turn-helix domain-containing protein [Caldimonas sp.]